MIMRSSRMPAPMPMYRAMGVDDLVVLVTAERGVAVTDRD